MLAFHKSQYQLVLWLIWNRFSDNQLINVNLLIGFTPMLSIRHEFKFLFLQISCV